MQQLAQREGQLADQQRLAQSALATHQGAVAIQDELVKSARANVERYGTLATKGFVAPAVLAQYKNALNLELAKRNALTLNLSVARRALLQVQQEAGTLLAAVLPASDSSTFRHFDISTFLAAVSTLTRLNC